MHQAIDANVALVGLQIHSVASWDVEKRTPKKRTVLGVRCQAILTQI